MKKRIFKELLHNTYFEGFICSLIGIIFFCSFILIHSHKALFPYEKKEVTDSYSTKEIDEFNDKTIYRTTYYFESDSELYFDKMCNIESEQPIDDKVKYVYTDYNNKGKCYTSKPFNYSLLIVFFMSFITPFFVISLICLPNIIKFIINSKKRMDKIRGDKNEE